MFPGSDAIFAVFSPDGQKLLVVTGPAWLATVYVFDPTDASNRVLGPQGAEVGSVDQVPATWDLSTAAWSADGSSVLLVPRTQEATGAVLSIDPASGAISRLVELDASLANASPSLWSTRTGLVIAPTVGDAVHTAWWVDLRSGRTRNLIGLAGEAESLMLSSADPLGRTVLICPRRADGLLGATIAVAVPQVDNHQLLKESMSCAGSVFSEDGAQFALTVEIDGTYLLMLIDVASGKRLLTVPLTVPTPSNPPFLTWRGDVVVATDGSGDWPVPFVVVRLQR